MITVLFYYALLSASRWSLLLLDLPLSLHALLWHATSTATEKPLQEHEQYVQNMSCLTDQYVEFCLGLLLVCLLTQQSYVSLYQYDSVKF